MEGTIHLISNPKAGSYRDSKVREAISFFNSAGVKNRHYVTKSIGHAESLVKTLPINNNDIVVVCGGDGTLSEVANGLSGKKIKIGLLPMGTANVVAKNFGIPVRIIPACRHIMEQKVKNIELGESWGSVVCILRVGWR